MSQNILNKKLSNTKIFIFLALIIFTGIIFRLIFSHFELPLNSDNLQYFLFAIDHSLGETVNSFKVSNIGWPYFVSFFFTIFSSNNYMDFMGLQKIISITISSFTAIPIYFLGKKFFRKEFALLGSCLFIFDPRIIQNSTFGISDPLYIIGIVIAIVLLLNSKKNIEILAFIVLGLSIGVRTEGLFLIPAFIIIYFIQKKITKDSIIKILISLLVISIILYAITYNQNIENSDKNLFSNIDSNVAEIYTSPETKFSGSPTNLMIDGFINFIKFLGWSQFPIWILFAPAGFIILLISKNENTSIILTLLFFISLPTLYAFSFSNDVRYLFPLYPIFSLLSLFTLTKINLKMKSILKISIVLGLIISSGLFLIWKDIDIENENEKYDVMKKISDSKKTINYFGDEVAYRIPITLETIDFPSTSDKILKQTMKVVNISRINSLEEYMKIAEENALTHLIIKEKNDYQFLDDIFKNENNYPYLIKEYDLINNNQEEYLKILKINYKKYKMD
jgi:Gpi18-like mannosyltransferase